MLKQVFAAVLLVTLGTVGTVAEPRDPRGIHEFDRPRLTDSPGDRWLAARPVTRALLTEIVTWLSTNFDLPAIHDQPRVEFAVADRLQPVGRYAAAAGPPGFGRAGADPPRIPQVLLSSQPDYCQRLPEVPAAAIPAQALRTCVLFVPELAPGPTAGEEKRREEWE